MNRSRSRRPVLLFGLLVLVLAGSLAIRLIAREQPQVDEPEPPRPADPQRWTEGMLEPAVIPSAPPPNVQRLPFPPWGTTRRPQPSVRFHSDLDRIAPMGQGPHNAAVWFADFARQRGAREQELEASRQRREAATADLASQSDLVRAILRDEPRAFLPDDPLVLEAEAWTTQARMQFYEEVWPFEGADTQIPNLLMVLNLAKSWVARGNANDDLAAAMEDYRRAVRLGRLFRQEDVVLITDLVGLACIRLGLQGIYDRAITRGDSELALLVSVALSELAPMRAESSRRYDRVDLSQMLRSDWRGTRWIASEDRLRDVVAIASTDEHRRFRMEAIMTLGGALHHGSRGAAGEARQALEALLEHGDPLTAKAARWSMDHELPPVAID